MACDKETSSPFQILKTHASHNTEALLWSSHSLARNWTFSTKCFLSTVYSLTSNINRYSWYTLPFSEYINISQSQVSESAWQIFSSNRSSIEIPSARPTLAAFPSYASHMACRSISFSEVPQYSDDIPPASSCHHPDHLVWTTQLEQQLQYAQAQLAIAQSNWSEDQEIWINEVRLLLLSLIWLSLSAWDQFLPLTPISMR